MALEWESQCRLEHQGLSVRTFPSLFPCSLSPVGACSPAIHCAGMWPCLCSAQPHKHKECWCACLHLNHRVYCILQPDPGLKKGSVGQELHNYLFSDPSSSSSSRIVISVFIKCISTDDSCCVYISAQWALPPVHMLSMWSSSARPRGKPLPCNRVNKRLSVCMSVSPVSQRLLDVFLAERSSAAFTGSVPSCFEDSVHWNRPDTLEMGVV